MLDLDFRLARQLSQSRNKSPEKLPRQRSDVEARQDTGRTIDRPGASGQGRRAFFQSKLSEIVALTGRPLFPQVPQQPNYCDCGLYLLHFVEHFLKNPDYMLNIVASTQTAVTKGAKKSSQSLAEAEVDRNVWWAFEEAQQRRARMRGEVKELFGLYAASAAERRQREDAEKEIRRQARLAEKAREDEEEARKAVERSETYQVASEQASGRPPADATEAGPQVSNASLLDGASAAGSTHLDEARVGVASDVFNVGEPSGVALKSSLSETRQGGRPVSGVDEAGPHRDFPNGEVARNCNLESELRETTSTANQVPTTTGTGPVELGAEADSSGESDQSPPTSKVTRGAKDDAPIIRHVEQSAFDRRDGMPELAPPPSNQLQHQGVAVLAGRKRTTRSSTGGGSPGPSAASPAPDAREEAGATTRPAKRTRGEGSAASSRSASRAASPADPAAAPAPSASASRSKSSAKSRGGGKAPRGRGKKSVPQERVVLELSDGDDDD